MKKPNRNTTTQVHTEEKRGDFWGLVDSMMFLPVRVAFRGEAEIESGASDGKSCERGRCTAR